MDYRPLVQWTTASWSVALMLALTLLCQAPLRSQVASVDEVRTLASARDHDQRFDALTSLLRAGGVTFTVEPFTLENPIGREPRTLGRNIVVTIGSGPEDVIVGAHYDAVRLADGSLSPGAVDNAASSVMLVGVAAALREARAGARIKIVWFDMEESGLIGSQRYLDAHRSDRIRAMLNFDVNGYGETVLFGVPTDGQDDTLRRTMLQTCADEGVDCLRFDNMPMSDDRSFAKAGIPTLSIAHLPAAEAHQLWLMLNAPRTDPGNGRGQGVPAPPILQIIHSSEDTIGKVDGATLARAQRLALALIRRVAG